MKKFPDESLDSIEKMFAEKVLKVFPYYGEFWKELIGVRSGSNNRLTPYGLIIPPEIQGEEKKRILTCYEMICITHYSLFCQVAGAHHELELAESALKTTDDKRHFLFWEACDSFYEHLKNTLHMLYALYRAVYCLSGIKIKENKTRETFKNEKKIDKSVIDRISKLEGQLDAIRNTVVHFGRLGAYEEKGKYYFPLPLKKDVLWSELESSPPERQEINKFMNSNLIEVEEILNYLDEYLAGIINTLLTERGMASIP
jgi:hypothetical protein